MSDIDDPNLADLVDEMAGLQDVPFDIPAQLPVLPLRGSVLFPGVVMPLLVATPSSIELIDAVRGGDRIFVATALHPEAGDTVAPESLFGRGVVARILKTLELPNGKLNVIVQGVARVDLRTIESTEPYLSARIAAVESVPASGSIEVEALMLSVQRLLQQIVKLPSNLPPEVQALASASGDAGSLTDLVAAHLNLGVDEKQELLETDNVETRLKLVVSHLARQVKLFELSQKIETEVQDEIDKSQREFYLRERLRAIRRELGEDDEGLAEVEDLTGKIEDAKMPEEVDKVARQEVDRLAR
ncbi:MAG: LON peptidase substrate-binding domain-containing protein, partial [Acidobacteriota bacterium]